MPSAASLAQLKEHLCQREHLSHEECEKALLPTLEHASLVHSHLHHPNLDPSGAGGSVSAAAASQDTFDQTRNAIVYISLVVVVYVMVILWLVSANFRSAAANVATNTTPNLGVSNRYGGGLLGAVMGGIAVAAAAKGSLDVDDCETESLLVLQDEKGKSRPRCTTHFDEEVDGEPV